jgi:putative FmdB family regulatory protein
MPMYEYGCHECEHRFDRLRPLAANDSDLQCPRCKSTSIQRQFSVFAAHTRNGAASEASAPASSGGCGGCGGGCACASRN